MFAALICLLKPPQAIGSSVDEQRPNWFLVLTLLTLTVPNAVIAGVAGNDAFLYWVAMMLTLLSSATILSTIGLRGIFKAFLWANLFGMAALLFWGFDELLSLMSNKGRFSIGFFHFNLLAFLLGGSIGIQIWALFSASRHWRVAIWMGIILSFGITFMTSSRGSLVAIIVASATTLALMRLRNRSAKSIGRQTINLGLTLLLFVPFLALDVVQNELLVPIGTYLDTALELSSPMRGLDSGLSGRLDAWSWMTESLLKGIWLYGEGFRASDLIEFPIDNGYLVVLYDLGLATSVVIVGKYILTAVDFGRGIVEAPTKDELGLCVGAFFCLVCFLVNNIVARYLFGIGNPFSLLAIFLLISKGRRYRTSMGRIGSIEYARP